jgi:hypothetical protein
MGDRSEVKRRVMPCVLDALLYSQQEPDGTWYAYGFERQGCVGLMWRP